MRAASASTTGQRCLAALETVQAAGLVLPAGFEYRCPGDTQAFPGDRQHWGVACYYQMFCPDGAYIAVNPERVGLSDARLRYVVAHEIGHAVDYVATGSTTEESADAQAHAAGFYVGATSLHQAAPPAPPAPPAPRHRVRVVPKQHQVPVLPRQQRPTKGL